MAVTGTLTNNNTLTGFGLTNVNLINNAVIDVSGGVREIAGYLSSANTGTVFIESSGTLRLDGSASANIVNFKAATGVLDILQLGNVQSSFVIGSIQTGDKILLPNVPSGFTLSFSQATGTLAVISSGTTLGDLVFANPSTLTSGILANIVLQCFAEGTQITCPDGPRAIETLQIGDRVSLADGGAEEITWIGARRVECARHPSPTSVNPIRVAAHAFGRNAPNRTLFLSPDHAVFVDGVLVPVRYLTNGTTIRQIAVPEMTYYHFELRDHAIVLAEGLTVETLLPGADKTAFGGQAGAIALHPDFTAREWEARGCAPLTIAGPKLDAIRARLNKRAARGQRKKAA